MERSLKSLVLIRAKHLAESVSTPAFLADRDGNLIFYNEAAEAVVGRPFADVGRLAPSEWRDELDVRARDGSPFPLEAMPGWMAVQRHRPDLGHILFKTFDGTERLIATCAVPLFTYPEQFEGALIYFWDESQDGA